MRNPAIIFYHSLVFIAIAATVTGAEDHAANNSAADDRARVALTYLNQLAKGELDLAKHTALSEHCGIQRRKVLRTRIDFLKKNYFRDGDALTIEAQKVDSGLAGILVRAENTAAPLSTRIHTVALIKKGKAWKAAPLPGVFSNTGYGYDEKVEQSVRSLQRWMAQEKNRLESTYREQATKDFKSTLATIEQQAGLQKMSPEEAVENFLEQCRNKNLHGILASMGGASDALTEPMETTITLVTQGLNNKDTASEWHLVTSRSVIAQTLKIDLTRNEVAVGFFNPLERTKPAVLYFPTHKADGKIFVRLSPLLQVALLPENERWQQRWRHRRGDEDELRKQLPATIFKNIRQVSYPTSGKLMDHFLDSLKKEDFTDCIRLLPRKGAYFGKEDNQSKILSNLGNLWRSIHKLRSSPRRAFAIIEEKNLALAPLQYAKTNRTGEFETVKVWMIKDDDGWHLISPEELGESLGDDIKTSSARIKQRFLAQEKDRQDQQARDLLDKVVTITPPLQLKPVSADDAARLFKSYRAHLRGKDTQAALSSCAVLKGTSSIQTLKTFNYALRGAADHTNYDHVCGTTQRGKWTGLSVRTESKLVGINDYPLYLIVNTAKGPRVLLDIDLRQASNKGRELLNKKNWRKLEQILAKDSLDDVKAIFDEHLKLTAKDVEAQLKLRE